MRIEIEVEDEEKLHSLFESFLQTIMIMMQSFGISKKIVESTE